MRRALAALVCAACAAAALLHWRQRAADPAPRAPGLAPRSFEPQWTWLCRNERCERLSTSESSVLQSLETCSMLCASTQLWPQPTGAVRLATAAVPIRASRLALQILSAPSEPVASHARDAFHLLRDRLRDVEKNNQRAYASPSARDLLVRVTINGSGDPRMRLDTDESYKLSLRPAGNSLVAEIAASTFCGGRHALETLSQLIWFDPYADSLLILEAASIEDAPRFKYRSVMLDTARNFFPVADIMRTLDAMAACKLNTFHWHVSDSQSFPLHLESVPELARHGAYSPSEIYTTEEVRAIVRHAAVRGIRILLEVDAPAHVGRAWEWGPTAGLGPLVYCVETEPWSAYCGEPPCGQLNPRNPHVYHILEKVYAEIIKLTGVDDLFHIGGDEVSERCWATHHNDSDPMELWMEFTHRALRALERANSGKSPALTLLWSSRLTRTPYLERLDRSRVGVQVWGASRWPESRGVLDAGFRAVLSHVDAWYLDCGFGSWRDSSDGSCGPYRSWQQMYEHRPWADDGAAQWQVLGGAACQWTEQVGPGGVHGRVWPRAAAVAERLWADGVGTATPDVYARLDRLRERLAALDVAAAPLWPRWCSHNPHACL